LTTLDPERSEAYCRFEEIGIDMRILVLPDGRFSLDDMPQFALSESQLRSELLKRGNDEYRVDDIIARTKRFLCR
jgi:hypothetical protein